MLYISPNRITELLSTSPIFSLSGGNKSFLTAYQQTISQYFNSSKFKDKNLLLLYMETGTGKTLTSLVCALEGLKKHTFNHVIILSPKSVQDEFTQNLSLYHKLSNEPVNSKVENAIIMIPYNANNSYQQLKKLSTTFSDNLERTLFIIDEAHLFMKSIIKVNLLPTQVNRNVGNAKHIYDFINHLKSKKVLALTGTPSAKHPFETVPLFNLAGCNFETNFEAFTQAYIDTATSQIKRSAIPKLKSKLSGLVAYVKSDSSLQHLKAPPLRIIEVPMSKP